MVKKILLICFLIMGSILQAQQRDYPPEGFVYLHKQVPQVELEVRYFGNHNFLGRPVEGYHKPVIIISKEAAEALEGMVADLKSKGYGLKVFDAYRPQRAVNEFIKWARELDDTLMKREFYPRVPKQQLFSQGYIASRSGHSRGSTIDLTLVDLESKCEVDMGSSFDFFGEISHHGTSKISAEQQANREILKKAMTSHGFRLYPKEWWHYTLKDEPFPDTYFDFPIQ